MTTRTFTFSALALMILVSFAAKTQAQYIPNAYVSGRGTITASCTLADPCLTVDAALRVVSGGEVVILDSGVFRGFTITRSVTVTAAHGLTRQSWQSSTTRRSTFRLVCRQLSAV